MQLFQEFDNEGFDVSELFFGILQCSELRYTQNKEIHLFGLQFTAVTENASAKILKLDITHCGQFQNNCLA